MIDLVKQIMRFYITNLKEPSLADLKIEDTSILDKQANLFVTIYKSGEIRWSAWNVKELEQNMLLELIKNTIEAISKDSRFSPVSISEVDQLRIRIDEIVDRKLLNIWDIDKLDPLNSWILVIKRDYTKLAVILANISALLISWSDFRAVLDKKLKEKFKESDYYLYEIKTKITSDF